MGVLVVIGMPAIKKILVIRLSSIGDIILTTPLLRRLHDAYPRSIIDYCTKPPFVSLLSSNPRLATIYSPGQLPTEAYDLVIDLQNNARSRAMVSSLNVVHQVRYHKENWKKWLMVQFKINLYSSTRSVVDRYQESLKEFGVQDDDQGCELYPSSSEKAFAEPFFRGGIPSLALCFGANHFTKRYPPQRFAGLLSLLLDKKPLQVFLLGGTEDAAQASEILNTLPVAYRPQVANLAGSCTLMQTAALLERCDAVLCNDTGLMHMASAFGKKIFVLFGSSSSVFGFLPYHSPFELFEAEGLRCRPCSHIGRDCCPKGHFRCMNDLSEALIARKILDFFNGR